MAFLYRSLTSLTDACFIVHDHNGQALAYVYYQQEPGRRAAAHLLTRDEAWRIAVNIAKLPGAVAQDLSNSGTIRSPCLLPPQSAPVRPLVA